MTDSTDVLTLPKIIKARYRPSKDADTFLAVLRRTLIPGEKFRGARLALARSLREQSSPELLPKGKAKGQSIEGSHLFGDDAALWTCIVLEAAQAERSPRKKRRPFSLDEFRALVEAHWHRGAMLLQEDYEAVERKDVEFVARLTKLIGSQPPSTELLGGKTPALEAHVSVAP